MTAQKAQPLTEEMRPKQCKLDENGHCEAHKEMERGRALGVAFFKFAGWSIPIGLIVLIGVISFLSQRVDTVEGKVTQHIEGSNDKLDQIHHSVMTMEFNMREDFRDRGQTFTELKYMEEY